MILMAFTRLVLVHTQRDFSEVCIGRSNIVGSYFGLYWSVLPITLSMAFNFTLFFNAHCNTIQFTQKSRWNSKQTKQKNKFLTLYVQSTKSIIVL
jgi:hypothetical protein